jgi:hypothetical protein
MIVTILARTRRSLRCIESPPWNDVVSMSIEDKK